MWIAGREQGKRGTREEKRARYVKRGRPAARFLGALLAAGALAIFSLSFLIPIQARAENAFDYDRVQEEAEEPDTSLLEDLDFSEVQKTVDEILEGNFQFETTVLDLITGKQAFTLESFLESLIRQAGSSWETEKQILLSILVLGIAASLFSNFSTIFQNQQIADVSFEIAYMLLFLILLQVFSGAAELAAGVIGALRQFMDALIPAYCLAVTMASGTATAVVFYQFLLGLIYVLEWLIQEGLLGLIRVHVILVFINHLTKEEYLSQMTELVGKLAGWVLKTVLAVVIGFNTLQGIITPVIDSLKSTAFSRVTRMIPGIGNVAGSVTDVLLGSAVLIKNGIGAAALVVIVLLCLAPLVKLGILAVLLELASALIQPVSDKRMTGCVAGVGGAIRLLFRAVFTVAVLFVITVVVVTVSVRGSI